MNKKTFQIIFIIIIFVSLIILSLTASGFLSIEKIKKIFLRKETKVNQEQKFNIIDAYQIAFLKAKEWAEDVKLAEIKSKLGETNSSGMSNEWTGIFISPNKKGLGLLVTVKNKEILEVKEIPFLAKGGDFPEKNLISSQEAIKKMRQIKGYEKEEVLSIELIYDASGQWYWGIKTSKGVISIKATP